MTTARDKDFSQFSFSETANHYTTLRNILYQELNNNYPSFNCSNITLSDALQADKWRQLDSNPARQEWSWSHAYSAYIRKSEFKRFDLCVKNSGFVCGLAYGRPSRAKTQLKIDIIESTPIEHHKNNTRVFEIISKGAQYYAILLGADEIRIMNPLNKELVKYYASFGYDFVENKKKRLGVYCSMKIGDML